MREAVHVDAVLLERDREDLRVEAAQRQQRAVVGGCLHDDRVAGLHEQLEEERVGLHRAVRGDDLLAQDAVVFGDPVTQRDVAARSAVREGAGRVALEGAVGGRAEIVDGDDVE
jgi:hypothetical protein